MKKAILAIVAAAACSTMAAPAEASMLDVVVTRVEADLEVRREIRSMDIRERPDRTGHFYGNTVRRRHRQGVSILY